MFHKAKKKLSNLKKKLTRRQSSPNAMELALKDAGVEAPSQQNLKQKNSQNQPVKKIRKRRWNKEKVTKKENQRNHYTKDGKHHEVIKRSNINGVEYRKTIITDKKIDSTQKKQKEITQENKTKVVDLNEELLVVQVNSSINEALYGSTASYKYKTINLSEDELSRWDKSGGEVYLIIGLDFGTTFTKVVVQEPDSEQSWVIPFNNSNIHQYLIPSCVYHNDDKYSLEEDINVYDKLKVPFLNKEIEEGHPLHVIAFLTLIIKHAKNWILKNKFDELSGLKPVWFVNIGLPAKNLEDKKLVNNYKVMILSSMLLSETQKQLNKSLLEAALVKSHMAVAGGKDQVKLYSNSLYLEHLNIVPEISAQIKGYIHSDRWDRSSPKFMLVDIGGGTVDSAVFNVTQQKDEEGDNFSFFSSSVESSGAQTLHNRRLEWLNHQISTESPISDDINLLIKTNKSLEQVPDSVTEYIVSASYPQKTIDDEFYIEYSDPLINNIKKAMKVDPNRREWASLPFMLCGGGQHVVLYKKIIKMVNNNRNYSYKFKEIKMPMPDGLEAPGLSKHEYNRISVAYGLSFLSDNDHMFTPDKFNDEPRIKLKTRMESKFIGSEQV